MAGRLFCWRTLDKKYHPRRRPWWIASLK